jgi:hypothetical protein
MLKAIPNIFDYIAPHDELPEILKKDPSWKLSTKQFNDFLDFIANAPIDMDHVKNVYIPHTLRSLPNFRYNSSCDQLHYDFLATKAPIGFLLHGKVRRFLKIPKGVHFAEILDTIKGIQTGNILFFSRTV